MMIDATLLMLVLAVLFGGAIQVGESSGTKLDAAYASRHMAFSDAVGGCTGGSVPGATPDQPQTDPDAEKIANTGSDGRSLGTGMLVNFARGTTTATSPGPFKVAFHSSSYVACIPRNGGHFKDWDPTSMLAQIPAVGSALGDFIKGWTGMSWF